MDMLCLLDKLHNTSFDTILNSSTDCVVHFCARTPNINATITERSCVGGLCPICVVDFGSTWICPFYICVQVAGNLVTSRARRTRWCCIIGFVRCARSRWSVRIPSATCPRSCICCICVVGWCCIWSWFRTLSGVVFIRTGRLSPTEIIARKVRGNLWFFFLCSS